MKFLLFNAVVVAALIFLFRGDDLSFPSLASPTLPTVKTVVPKLEPKPPEPEAAAVTPAAPEPAPLSPEVIKRRAAVLAPHLDEAPLQSRFMSRQERRQSLLSMAEDMELFSAEAVTR